VAREHDDEERALAAFRPARWMPVANAIGISCAYGADVAALGFATSVQHAVVSAVAMAIPIVLDTRWQNDRRSSRLRRVQAIGACAAWMTISALVAARHVQMPSGWIVWMTVAQTLIAWVKLSLFAWPRRRADARIERMRTLADAHEAWLARVHVAYLAPIAIAMLVERFSLPNAAAFALALVPLVVAFAIHVAVDRRRRARAALLASASPTSPVRIDTREGLRRLVRVRAAASFRDADDEEVVCALDERGEPHVT
jgi:hypothetical protein